MKTAGWLRLEVFVIGVLFCGLLTACGTTLSAPPAVFSLSCNLPKNGDVLVEVVREVEIAGSSRVPITIACADQHSYAVANGGSTHWTLPAADGGGGEVDIVTNRYMSLLPLPTLKNLSGCEADQELLVKDLEQLFAGHPLYVTDRAEADLQLLACVHHLFS